MLVDLIWLIVWIMTLLATLVVADTIINDREFADRYNELTDEGRTRLVSFFATPVFWAVIVIFYFH